jgi:hypothetical protein
VRSWGIEVCLEYPVERHDSSRALQQLLAIWRDYKGKERDALLWGDEVHPPLDCFTDMD